MSWLVAYWQGQVAVLHEHEEVLFFINKLTKKCPLCGEQEPKEIIFQEQLLGGNFYEPQNICFVNQELLISDTSGTVLLIGGNFNDTRNEIRIYNKDEKKLGEVVKRLLKEFKDIDIISIVYFNQS